MIIQVYVYNFVINSKNAIWFAEKQEATMFYYLLSAAALRIQLDLILLMTIHLQYYCLLDSMITMFWRVEIANHYTRMVQVTYNEYSE